ncbi:MAG: hypothetical protein ACLTW9_30335 [Enterocloster sp.]
MDQRYAGVPETGICLLVYAVPIKRAEKITCNFTLNQCPGWI